MEHTTQISRAIARSHMYWGRKPLPGLLNIFNDLTKSDIVLDPFCGAGNPSIAAIMKGARVIASDLNPMSLFLTKVLVQSISIPTLELTFEQIKKNVAKNILNFYLIKCPNCKKETCFDFLIWNGNIPIAVKINCQECGFKTISELSNSESKKQIALSKTNPEFWYPERGIHSTRKPPVKYHHELFTGRNLSMLAELYDSIEKISDVNCGNALKFVFTSMLYSCSNMQMLSNDFTSASSRGWTAPRFYVPPKRKEKNVWLTFENRFFNSFLKCKRLLNAEYFAKVTDSPKKFFSEKSDQYEILITQSDVSESINKFGKDSNFIFLDPPYNEDIDYFAFSEFWGAWLEMKFDFKKEWHPKKYRGEELEILLELANRNTSHSCMVSLALSPKNVVNWNAPDNIVKSGYSVKNSGLFVYDNSNRRGGRRGRGIDKQKDEYFILHKDKDCEATQENRKKEDLFPYIRVSNFLLNEPNSIKRPIDENKIGEGKIRAKTSSILPEVMRKSLKEITDKIISNERSKEPIKNAYHSLCFALIKIILSKDMWSITYVKKSHFEEKAFGVEFFDSDSTNYDGMPLAFVAQKNDQKILFYFYEDIENLNKFSPLISSDFKDIHVLIVRSEELMNRLRKSIDFWQQGFYTCFEHLASRCQELNINEFKRLLATDLAFSSGYKRIISTIDAKITANIPVGGDKDSAKYFKLRFNASNMPKIVPGQFIMINTSPIAKTLRKPVLLDSARKASSKIDIKQRAYIKRPFGIHRAFYPNFGQDYLKKLSLPPYLSTVLHTALPNEFDIFYKVLEYGIGTNEMKNLKEGQKIQIIGPLGDRFDLRKLRTEGFEEVHVIGGGVGMAPLIFMVQALRFFAFEVKAFIGIESLDMLRHKDINFKVKEPLFDGFTATANDIELYVYDLLATGVSQKDIFVSSDKSKNEKETAVLSSNFYKGFVSEQYKNYILSNKPDKKILVISCGPTAMMKKIFEITEENGFALKVLLEKRMACGIGVCLSCVCMTKNDYARVCVDGPVFDAEEIQW